MEEKIIKGVVIHDSHGNVVDEAPIYPQGTEELVSQHNADQDAHPHIKEAITGLRTKVEDRITDVMVVGRDGSETSMSEYDDQGNKVVKLPQDSMGKVDGVKVNGEELEVDDNGKVDINFSATVDGTYSDTPTVTPTIGEDGIQLDFQGLRGNGIVSSSEVLSNEDGGTNIHKFIDNMGNEHVFRSTNGHTGGQGPQGTSAIWSGNAEVLTELEHTNGQATNRTMSQKAITDELISDKMEAILPPSIKFVLNANTGVWVNGETSESCYLIPVQENGIVILSKKEAAASNYSYAFLGSDDVSEENPADYIGSVTAPIWSSATLYLVVPSGARFLYVRCLYSSNDVTPYIYLAATNNRRISKLEDKTPRIELIGKGNTYVLQTISVDPNLRYLLYVRTRNWSVSKTGTFVSPNNYLYGINCKSVGESDFVELEGKRYSDVSANLNQLFLNKFYFFPQNVDSVKIGFRADPGQVFVCDLLNLSDFEDMKAQTSRANVGRYLWIESDNSITNVNSGRRFWYFFAVKSGDSITIEPVNHNGLDGSSTGTMYAFIYNNKVVDGTSRTWASANDGAITLGTPENKLVQYIAVAGYAHTSNSNRVDYSPAKVIINGVEQKILVNYDYDSNNIKAFGAKGDGATIDTLAFETMFSRGGDIYIPEGTYIIDAPINVKSNTHVTMDKNAVILRSSNSTQNSMFRTEFYADTTEYNGVKNVSFKGGMIDLNESNNNAAAAVAIMHAKNIIFDGVTFKNALGNYHYVDMGGCKNIKYLNCVFLAPRTGTGWGELIQIDYAHKSGAPYITYEDGSACYDLCACNNVEICGCTFYTGAVTPAVGNHNPGYHKNVNIHDNVIYGPGRTAGTLKFGAFAFHMADAYVSSLDGVNHTKAFIHHNHINDCDYIITTTSDSQSMLIVRDNVFCNFGSVTKPNDDAGIELMNNIEINEQ